MISQQLMENAPENLNNNQSSSWVVLMSIPVGEKIELPKQCNNPWLTHTSVFNPKNNMGKMQVSCKVEINGFLTF